MPIFLKIHTCFSKAGVIFAQFFNFQNKHRDNLLYFSDLVVLGFNATLTATVVSWRLVTHVSPGFLTPVLTQLFLRKPLTTFLTCFWRGERRKYARKKSHLNQGWNSQQTGHESDKLTTEPSGRGFIFLKNMLQVDLLILITSPRLQKIVPTTWISVENKYFQI